MQSDRRARAGGDRGHGSPLRSLDRRARIRHLVSGRGLLPYRLVVRKDNARAGRFRRSPELGIRAADSDATADPRGELHRAVDTGAGLKVRATRGHGRRLGRLRTVVRGSAPFHGVKIGVGRRGRGLVVWSAGPSGAGVRAAHLPR